MVLLRLAGLLLIASCQQPKVLPAGRETAVAVDTAVLSVVQRQVDAYNRRDLDVFIGLFAPDARIYLFPDSLMYSGRDKLREVYGNLFKKSTDLHAVVTQRIVQGRFVIDREITTGLQARGPLTGVAIYEVRSGLVTRIWFVD